MTIIRPNHPAPVGAEAVPDSHGLNLYRADPALAALLPLYLPRDLVDHLAPHLDRLGALAGGRLAELAAEADTHPPVLNQRTRRGEDAQSIAYHPAYREMERIAFGEYGLAALSHRAGVLDWPAPMPAAAKYAITYLFVQAEFGLCCPVSMTDSLARTLRKFGAPEMVERYLPALTSQDMDELFQGAMFMTEQGAGSDIANTAVTATPGADGTWALHGDKWFCSNADAELAMVLARPEGAAPGIKGVSLFLLPRTLPDGSANRYRIVRLKEKLGTRSMASRRDPAGRRHRLDGRRSRRGHAPDGRHGEQLPPVERRARGGHDAPRGHRGAVHRPSSHRLRHAGRRAAADAPATGEDAAAARSRRAAWCSRPRTRCAAPMRARPTPIRCCASSRR